jgi:hypothetical protein
VRDTVLAEVAIASKRCQRWRDRKASWRRAEDGGFDHRRYEVHPIDDTTARIYVLENHYARSYPAAVRRFGLFDTAAGQPRLAGVAVFGVPARDEVLTKPLPGLQPYRAAQTGNMSLEFSRLVLDDTCPGNSARSPGSSLAVSRNCSPAASAVSSHSPTQFPAAPPMAGKCWLVIAD